jgi:glutamyl-tRNA synthetase
LLVLMPAMKVRLKKLKDAAEFLRFLDEEAEQVALSVDQLSHKKLPPAEALDAFREARAFVQEAPSYDVDSVAEKIIAIGEAHTTNDKAGPFLGRMRLAVTRQQVSPPLFESMVALGRERTLARLDEAISVLDKGS